MQEQDSLVELPSVFFPQNVLQLHQQRLVIICVDNLALWKVINDEGTVLIPKKSRRELFQRIFALEIFWVWVSRYAATTVIVALSRSHSDITRFRPWSPVATVHHLDRTEKNPNLLRRLALLKVLIRVQTFRDSIRGESPHIQIMNDGHNSLT